MKILIRLNFSFHARLRFGEWKAFVFVLVLYRCICFLLYLDKNVQNTTISPASLKFVNLHTRAYFSLARVTYEEFPEILIMINTQKTSVFSVYQVINLEVPRCTSNTNGHTFSLLI